MKTNYPFILFFILSLITFSAAQAQMMPPMGGGAGKGGGIPKAGKIYGKVIDSKSGKPVDGASVILLQKQNGKDALVKGGLTEANGEFSLEELPLFGQFQLVITIVGYKEYRQTVAFDMAALMKMGAAMKAGGGTGSGDNGGMPNIPAGAGDALNAINKDLGNIRIEATAEQLKGVTVTAKTPTFVMQGEKKIFNVDQNLTSQGGTATDVMKSVPGVLVDADGKVTIRNSSPQLLIDGKQSPLTLDQIPADAIESIEVITNPSAKYDAEGGAGGVLNVVLKKNRKKGYNGDVRAGADSRGGGNLGGDFNIRSGKFNLSANANGNLNRSLQTGYTNRRDSAGTVDENDVNKTRGGFAFGRIGLDYFITNRTTISIGGVTVHGRFTPDDNLHITTMDSLGHTAWSRRTTGGHNQFDMNGAQFGIKHIFPKAGEEWTFDATGNFGMNHNDNQYATIYYADPSESMAIGQPLNQGAIGSGHNDFYTFQTDYALPFANKSKLEVGLKATIRHMVNTNNNYIDILNNGNDSTIANPNSDYKSTDQVYAAYGSYSGNVGANTSYQLGLRAENSEYTGTIIKRDTSFSTKYPVNLFPSVFISHKLKNDQQLQLSYRRGITRPNFFQLLPFTDNSDPLSLRTGNPGLKPEFTNSLEANYMKNFHTNYILASIYYRHSSNLITQYIASYTGTTGTPAEAGALISTFLNASSSDRYGVELTAQWDLTKWWNVLGNVNIYNASISNGLADSLVSPSADNSYLSGFAKLTNNFKLPKKFSLQVTGLYQSKTNLLPDNSGGGGFRGGFVQQASSSSQGYLAANYSVDAALRFTFLKGDAASLSLSMNDIFGTRKFLQHSESEVLVQNYSRLVNPHMVRLNFSYRFGKIDTDLFRRKNVKGQMENLQDASQNSGL